MTTPSAITTSGGLISAAFIESIREATARIPGAEPAAFALPWAAAPKGPAAMEETIAAAWELLLERWDAVRAQLPLLEISQLRARWLISLFHLLDFDPVYQRGDIVLDSAGKLRFPISHRGWLGEGAPAIHTVAPTQDLDARTSAGAGLKGKSPHDLVQAFLNASPADHWGILTNGILLRLLRDYHHTFTKGYVQFDLESMLETRNYGDFRALYRMVHASRFVAQGEGEEAVAPLERFYHDSIATGIKVGEDLRGQVRQAIETLGNGFLDGDLIRQLQDNPAACHRYYSDILHVIYRILFLLFAEQRGMMPGRDSLYAEAYSIAALRARAEVDLPREDDFTDLWEGLQVTFRMVREGVPELGVFGYDGMLFEDAGPHPLPLRNSDLLHTIRALTLIEREGVLQRISYADLGVEELGSIYESLLDYTPRVSTTAEVVEGREVAPHTFFLDPRGSERKTSGSYYTHPSLVNELIKSALLPVVRERLAAAGLPVIAEEEIGEVTAGLLGDYAGLSPAQRAAGEQALLALKVCDPAAGSGHFLVKANNALGAELARIRSGDEYPSEAAVQAARRDVLAHCLYAVDLNLMAVELCKVSLWINASVPDRPLSFLDHHIKCGNSLIGATPELLEKGVPTEAFAAGVTGNDPATAKAVRRRNQQELEAFRKKGAYQMRLPLRALADERVAYGCWEVSTLAEDRPQMARERYAAYCTGAGYRQRKLEADLWTAAFFWPLTAGGEWFPTQAELQRLQAEGPEVLPAAAVAQIERLAGEQYRFFHWHLEFPEVFGDSPLSPPPPAESGHPLPSAQSGEGRGPGGEERSGPGFDVFLGNPPWEMINLMEKEFFASRAPEIANAPTGAERKRRLRNLSNADPELHTAYTRALRDAGCLASYLQHSDRSPLTSGGRINTYAVFTELARTLIQLRGRAGLLVPSGIATDYTYRDFFADLVETGRLASLYDFENREGLFPQVDSRMKFSLLTMTAGGIPTADFAFFLHTVNDLADPERRFPLTREDLALFNPNTRTCPVFRTRRDAELTRRLYRAAPVLVNEATGENPWGISFKQGLFNMTSDSHSFCTREELELKGFVLQGNLFLRDEETYLPLYEGRMIHHFDHRPVSVGITAETQFRSGVSIDTTAAQHTDSCFTSMPRYWVEGQVVEDATTATSRKWFIAFKDITSPTNERTLIATIIPFAAVGNSAPLLLFSDELASQSITALVGSLAAFVIDFVARQKLGGVHVNFYLLEQFPILPPSRYTPELLSFIVPRVVELTYTAWDLQPFAQDVLAEVGEETWARWFAGAPVHTCPPPAGQPATPAPFIWNEGRRAVLRAELDALYAHLYGLTREDLAYILDTFPIVRRKDEERWGEYRTKNLIMENYDLLEGRFTPGSIADSSEE